MAKNLSAYQGCLLGMAVGDAMGYTIDGRSWDEIRENYGPNGLLGYDLVNGYADVTSYTQLAAFTCNALMVGLTHGRRTGTMSPFIKYAELGQREWAASQRAWGRPEKTFCWLMQRREICGRHCMDTRMLEAILRRELYTPEEPRNAFADPTAITAAVGVGLFFEPEDMDQEEFDRLGMEVVALTHGSPMAYLPGALVAHLVSLVLRRRKHDLKELVEESVLAFRDQFGLHYRQVDEICALVKQAIALSEEESISPVNAMEQLRCENGAQVLAGAIYASLVGQEDFDTAMIVAVNHSGRSAAVGALTGAILGARMGMDSLPEFYLECLEPADTLRELADDVYRGCPFEQGRLFSDPDWEKRYVRGGR